MFTLRFTVSLHVVVQLNTALSVRIGNCVAPWEEAYAVAREMNSAPSMGMAAVGNVAATMDSFRSTCASTVVMNCHSEIQLRHVGPLGLWPLPR